MEVRKTLEGQNDNLSKSITAETEKKAKAEDARTLALNEQAEAEQGLSAAVAKAGELQRTLDDIGNELDESVAREGQITKAIDAIKALFPGTDLDGVPAKYQEMVDNEKKLNAELAELEDFKSRLQDKIAKNKGEIVRAEGKIDAAEARVAGNTFQATVTSVDSDWDFVIIGAGEKSGLAGDSKLLVQRGGRLLGKLSVSKLGANQAVADIEPGSLRPGVVLRPGDQVILQTVRSN